MEQGFLGRWAQILFGSQEPKERIGSLSEENIITYLLGLVNRIDLIGDEVDEFRRAKAVWDIRERRNRLTKLYFSLEDFLIANKPLVTKYEFASKNEVRNHVREHVPITDVGETLALVFYDEKRQMAHLFNVGLRMIVRYISRTIGEEELRRIIEDATSGTVLAAAPIEHNDFVLKNIATLIENATIQSIKNAYRHVYAALLKKITEVLGEKTAVSTARQMYETIADVYDKDLLSLFLDVFPEGYLEGERLAVLSREELEIKVLEATEALRREKEGVERKVIERTRDLHEEEARLVASVNSLGAGFALFDNARKTILVNKPLKHLLRLDVDPTTFNTLAEVLRGSCDLNEVYDQCLREKKPIRMDEVRWNGAYFRLLIAPVIMMETDATAAGAIVLIEDITEATLLEKTKDEFFAVASHELRTPLTAISGNAKMIKIFFKEKINDPDIVAMIDDIKKASDRLIGIVNDFLDISALEQKRSIFKEERFDIGEVLRETIHQIQPLANKKGLTVTCINQDSTIHHVAGDRNRVEQVITNIISNAISYTETGGVTCEMVPRQGFVDIFFRDTGIGILPEHQRLLFRKFQQAGENVLSRMVAKGTGLGLYISKLIIEKMGGEIVLEHSEPGKGSTFRVSLPVV